MFSLSWCYDPKHLRGPIVSRMRDWSIYSLFQLGHFYACINSPRRHLGPLKVQCSHYKQIYQKDLISCGKTADMAVYRMYLSWDDGLSASVSTSTSVSTSASASASSVESEKQHEATALTKKYVKVTKKYPKT